MKITQLLLLLFTSTLLAQTNYRPALFFREDWKEIPAEIPLNQKHVSNSELTVLLYGPGKENIKKSNHDKPVDDPYYVWSGLCLGNWMVSLKHQSNNVDLTGFSKIKFRSKQAGLRNLRITLKLKNGTWLVSNLYASPSTDWRIWEFNLQEITWHTLDAQQIIETGIAKSPNLSEVTEIGFTDLMPGGLSTACSRLDWIEVYGNSILR